MCTRAHQYNTQKYEGSIFSLCCILHLGYIFNTCVYNKPFILFQLTIMYVGKNYIQIFYIYIYICILYMWPHIIFFKNIIYIYIIYLSYFIFMFIRHLILVLLQLYITRIYYYFYLNAYFYKIFSFLKMCVST